MKTSSANQGTRRNIAAAEIVETASARSIPFSYTPLTAFQSPTEAFAAIKRTSVLSNPKRPTTEAMVVTVRARKNVPAPSGPNILARSRLKQKAATAPAAFMKNAIEAPLMTSRRCESMLSTNGILNAFRATFSMLACDCLMRLPIPAPDYALLSLVEKFV